jgi:hypothetical protein
LGKGRRTRSGWGARAGKWAYLTAALVVVISAINPVAACAAHSGPAAAPATLSPREADSLVDSMGINVHLSRKKDAYANYDQVKSALLDLGIRHIRDGIVPPAPYLYDRLNDLARSGIDSNLIMGSPTGPQTMGELLGDLKANLLSSATSVEGANELDNGGKDANWAADDRTWQQQLWQGVKQDPALSHLSVIGPSLVRGISRSQLGDLSAYIDAGNMHNYPGGQPPERGIGHELQLDAAVSSQKPIASTETGYLTRLNTVTGNKPVPDQVQAVYMPRIVADDYLHGTPRTYLYELFDESSAKDSGPGGFGIITQTYAPKPAFTSLKNLIALLADPGPQFAPTSLQYSVSGGGNNLEQVLLQKRDGSYWLLLWQAVSIWDANNQTNVSVGAVPATVTVNTPMKAATLYRPLVGTTPSAPTDPRSIQVPVQPDITIVRLDPQSCPIAKCESVNPTRPPTRPSPPITGGGPTAAGPGGSTTTPGAALPPLGHHKSQTIAWLAIGAAVLILIVGAGAGFFIMRARLRRSPP